MCRFSTTELGTGDTRYMIVRVHLPHTMCCTYYRSDLLERILYPNVERRVHTYYSIEYPAVPTFTKRYPLLLNTVRVRYDVVLYVTVLYDTVDYDVLYRRI